MQSQVVHWTSVVPAVVGQDVALAFFLTRFFSGYLSAQNLTFFQMLAVVAGRVAGTAVAPVMVASAANQSVDPPEPALVKPLAEPGHL